LKATHFLTRWGVETNGIDPIPPDGRIDMRLFQVFFVWLSANMNVLGVLYMRTNKHPQPRSSIRFVEVHLGFFTGFMSPLSSD